MIAAGCDVDHLQICLERGPNGVRLGVAGALQKKLALRCVALRCIASLPCELPGCPEALLGPASALLGCRRVVTGHHLRSRHTAAKKELKGKEREYIDDHRNV